MRRCGDDRPRIGDAGEIKKADERFADRSSVFLAHKKLHEAAHAYKALKFYRLRRKCRRIQPVFSIKNIFKCLNVVFVVPSEGVI